MRRQALLIISVVALILILIADNVWYGAPPRGEITVGNKGFTEQYIAGELLKQLLEDRGFTVKLKSGRSSMYLREGIEFGDIDVYAEYTGTAWMLHLVHKYRPGMDNNEVHQLVNEEDTGNGIIWLDPMWNDNTYALVSWPDFVEEHGLTTLSDLAALYREKAGEVRTCIGLEFSTRPDGLPALERHYNFEVAQSHIMVMPVVAQKSLERKEVDVAMVFGTDAEVAEHGWHIYTDDKAFFPPYDLTPCVRKEVLDRYPEIDDILNELVATFPGGGQPATPEIVAECQKVWQELNAKVKIDEMEPDEVAREYLVEHGLITE
ncbi:MAG: ABC transporter substrate-binding protein [Planctomycetota bacterium]|jgi:osmoprotectant transport system substrate-binding protein